MEMQTDRLRVAVLVVVVGCFALAIGARLYSLQVVQAERFRLRAADQHRDQMTVAATRGKILDRNGEVLAVSIEARSLYAHPRRVDDPDGIARRLAPVLGRSQRELAGLLRSDRSFVWLERFLERETVERIEELGLPIGGPQPLGFQPEPKRVYPRGHLASHVVGFTNIDHEGMEGIEVLFDEVLRGDPTIYLVLQDAKDGRLLEKVGEPVKQPHDVVLTIDATLQHIVERELNAAVRELRPSGATAIVLDPETGHILALANRPAIDLNEYRRSRPGARRNRAVADQYEPGSTFKIVSMAAALEEKKIGLSELFDCERGTYRVGSRTIRDVAASDRLTPAGILERSSNIGIVKVVDRLTPGEFDGIIRRFGFGERTGVELPGEISGAVRSTSDWSGATMDSMAFGQEISVTPLQMAQALATVANGGLKVPPRVVLGTRDPEGRFRPGPPATPQRVIGREAADQLTRMLAGVMARGSGRRGNLEEYRLAGKSGTAQKAVGGGYSETDYVASFGGFGPVDDPRLVVLVVIDSPRGEEHLGGRVAAPIFGRIMLEGLRHLRVPSDLHETPKLLAETETGTRLAARSEPAPPAVPATTFESTPDLIGRSSREAIAILSALGCNLDIQGKGFVVAQVPAPGSRVERGASCRIRLSENVPDPRRRATPGQGRTAS